MSYLVLARKYRPQTFPDMVGQDHVIRPLANALKSGRVAHAYLFSGARGVGKTTVARLLAMALNCLAPEDERPCGQCDSCLEISDGHAVDVFEIDGASNRGINEIRDLRETTKYMPSKGRLKVYIIDEVHMLTKEAFNALLKTLEEPPAHVVFIFATTEAHKVLPTILSRCQRYDFKRIKLTDIMNRLQEIAVKEGIEISQTALRLLARESEGGLRDALSLFDQAIAFSGNKIRDEDLNESLGLIDQTLIAGLAKYLLAGDAGGALDVLDRIYNYGHDTKDFAIQVLNYFRSLVVIKVSRSPETILDMIDAELADLKKVAGQASLETLNFHFNAWLEVQGRLHRTNQPRMVLEALIIRLAQVEPLRPLAELAARLETLLNSLGQAGPVSGSSTPPPAPRAPYGRSGPGGGYRSAAETREATPESSNGGSQVREAAPEPSRYAPAPDNRPQPVETSKETSTAGPAPVDDAVSGPDDPGPDRIMDWASFAAESRKDNVLLFTFLDQGQVRAFGPGRVEVVFGNQALAELLDRERFLEVLTEYLGRRPQLVVGVEDGAEGALLTPASVAAENSARASEEILNHPLVKEARQIFSGEVVKVIPEV